MYEFEHVRMQLRKLPRGMQRRKLSTCRGMQLRKRFGGMQLRKLLRGMQLRKLPTQQYGTAENVPPKTENFSQLWMLCNTVLSAAARLGAWALPNHVWSYSHRKISAFPEQESGWNNWVDAELGLPASRRLSGSARGLLGSNPSEPWEGIEIVQWLCTGSRRQLSNSKWETRNAKFFTCNVLGANYPIYPRFFQISVCANREHPDLSVRQP